MVEYLAGVLQIANVFLIIIAAFFALSLFKVSHKTKHLRPWKILILVAVLFAVEEILGALLAFNKISPTFLTHLIPSIMMVLLIFAVDVHTKQNTKVVACKKRKKK